MLDIFKDYDLIDEMNKKINKEEDVFAECRPNKLPFLIKRLLWPFVITISIVILLVLYLMIRPRSVEIASMPYVIEGLIDWIFIFVIILAVAFFLFQFYMALLDMKFNYYVIATDGIHFITYEKRVTYFRIDYKDIKSVILKKNILGTGDILIKEKTDKDPKSAFDKFKNMILGRRRGMFGIDDAQKVYDVIKTIAIQDNDTIFFADPSNSDENDVFNKRVKKYKNQVKEEKASSVMEAREK